MTNFSTMRSNHVAKTKDRKKAQINHILSAAIGGAALLATSFATARAADRCSHFLDHVSHINWQTCVASVVGSQGVPRLVTTGAHVVCSLGND